MRKRHLVPNPREGLPVPCRELNSGLLVHKRTLTLGHRSRALGAFYARSAQTQKHARCHVSWFCFVTRDTAVAASHLHPDQGQGLSL